MIRVATVGDPNRGREVLLFMGMLAGLDSAELRRSALLADEWEARITLAEIPDGTEPGARLTAGERADLRRGDFTSLARRMVRAAQDVNPQLRRVPTIMLGYSLGSSLAAAAASDAGLLQVSELTLVEPVALRRRNPLRLLRSVRIEHRAATVAEEFTPTGGYSPTRTDLAHLGYALSRGRLAGDIVRAGQLQSLSVYVVRGRESRLCVETDVDRALRMWRRNGIEARHISLPGRHNLWHSPTKVASLARKTARFWPETGSAQNNCGCH